ncbi:MAG: sensor histidine kinase [Rhodocyclales bacterium]|nr:sensor histidine kinase [Rhodocyclales bacterium]
MMTLRHSLRLRLLLGTLVWIVVSLVVAGWGLSSLFSRHVSEQFHAELATHLDQLTAHLVVDGRGAVSLSAQLSDPRLARPYAGLYWQVDRVAGDGDVAEAGVLRSRSLWDVVLAVPDDAPMDGEIHRHGVTGPGQMPLRMMERVVKPGEPAHGAFRLIVAADEALMLEPARRLTGLLVVALAVLGLGLVIAAVVQVVGALAPLRQLQRALGAVRGGQAGRIEGRFPVEIQPLVSEFNTVLGENAEVVERARTHAGNLAHALKTPLSILANAAREADGELARLVAEQVEAANKQVAYHLTRARAAASARMPGTRTLVGPVVEGLLRVMARVHAGRNLQLNAPAPAEDAWFRGETQDLQEILGNLLDNACKWARARVDVTIGLHAGEVWVDIDDDGPGIAEAVRANVFARGVRADEAAPGSGLGLSIVADLVQLYGGHVRLDPSPLGGVRAHVTLPAPT